MTYLIAQPDGSEWPWGWGAVLVETRPADWRCEFCGKQPNLRRKKIENYTGCHVYLFGPPRCTPCAESWCRANWPRRVVRKLRP